MEGVVLPPSSPAPATPALIAPPKKGFWGVFGTILAKIGKVALSGALWASEHPQVVEAVAAAAGQPKVAAAVATYGPAAGAVASALTQSGL